MYHTKTFHTPEKPRFSRRRLGKNFYSYQAKVARPWNRASMTITSAPPEQMLKMCTWIRRTKSGSCTVPKKFIGTREQQPNMQSSAIETLRPLGCLNRRTDGRTYLHAHVNIGTNSARTAWPLEADIHEMYTKCIHTAKLARCYTYPSISTVRNIRSSSATVADYSLGSRIRTNT